MTSLDWTRRAVQREATREGATFYAVAASVRDLTGTKPRALDLAIDLIALVGTGEVRLSPGRRIYWHETDDQR